MCKFSGVSCSSEEPFKGVGIGSRSEVDTFQMWSVHKDGPDNCEAFALSGVIVTFSVIKSTAEILDRSV